MSRLRFSILLCGVLALGALCAAGCESRGQGPAKLPGAPASVHPMVTVRGAGATFPYPVLARWVLAYHEHTGLKLEYQPSGSQGGVAAITAGTADFSATDIPLSAEEQQRRALVQFPLIIGGAVPVVHLPGVKPGELRLTAEVLAGIYLGEITHWNDPLLTTLNPKLPLPDHTIIPLHRADTSGTGRLFARYLTAASPTWRDARAEGRPMDQVVGVNAKNSDQMARFVKQFKYTLGYVEYSYAREHGLAWAALRNRAGAFVQPGREAFAAAAEQGSWQGMQLSLTDPSGAKSWPLTGASYVLLRREPKNPRKTRLLLSFFRWAMTEGRATAEGLQFVAIPRRHLPQIEQSWSTLIQANGAPLWPAKKKNAKPGAPHVPAVYQDEGP